MKIKIDPKDGTLHLIDKRGKSVARGSLDTNVVDPSELRKGDYIGLTFLIEDAGQDGVAGS